MLIRLVFLLALGLAAIAPNVAGAQTRTRRTPPAATRAPTAQDRAAFERGMLGSESGPLFVAIRRNFPIEYQAMVTRFMNIAIANSRSQARGLQEIGAELYAFQRSVMQYVAVAPDAAVLQVVRAEIAMFEAAERADPALCDRLVTRGIQMSTSLPADVSQLARAANVAEMDAAGAGRRNPVSGRAGDLTSAERDQLREAFTQFDPMGDLLPLADGTGISGAAPGTQCRYALAAFRTTTRLPPELGVRAALQILTDVPTVPNGGQR